MTIHNKPIIMSNTQGRRYEYTPLETITFFYTPTEAPCQSDVGEMEVRMLGGPPLHVHPNQEEIHYVLEGKLQYQVGEETYALQRGDCIFIPPGVPHAWVNLHQEPARILGILTPGGGEPFFKTIAESGGEMDDAAIATLAHRLGTDIVGPPLAATLTNNTNS